MSERSRSRRRQQPSSDRSSTDSRVHRRRRRRTTAPWNPHNRTGTTTRGRWTNRSCSTSRARRGCSAYRERSPTSSQREESSPSFVSGDDSSCQGRLSTSSSKESTATRRTGDARGGPDVVVVNDASRTSSRTSPALAGGAETRRAPGQSSAAEPRRPTRWPPALDGPEPGDRDNGAGRPLAADLSASPHIERSAPAPRRPGLANGRLHRHMEVCKPIQRRLSSDPWARRLAPQPPGR